MRNGLSMASPLGELTVWEEGGALTALSWEAGHETQTDLLTRAVTQLAAYFDGTLTTFDLPITIHASDAQQRACAAMAAIPFGETRTYGELAKELKLSAQAMGQLCGGNPLPIIVPCHRVLGTNGLGGFSARGGVESKVWLLRHEGAAGLLI